jgi:hypothetical protein
LLKGSTSDISRLSSAISSLSFSTPCRISSKGGLNSNSTVIFLAKDGIANHLLRYSIYRRAADRTARMTVAQNVAEYASR